MPGTQARLEFQSDLTRTSTPIVPDDVPNKAYVDAAIALATPDATAASGGGVKGIVTFDSDKALNVVSGVAEVVPDGTRGIEINPTSKALAVKVDGSTITFDGSGQIQSASIIDATSAPGGGVKGKVTADENLGLKITSGIMEVFPNTNRGLQNAATGLEVKVDGATVTFDGTGRLQASGGGGGSTQVTVDKNLTALVTTVDNDPATSSTITFSPAGYVRVLVNGIGVLLGNGVKAGVTCYFSGDGGTTARVITGIVSGDGLYWNGSVAGYELDASDRIDFDYEV
jgi:RNase P/RNase MRP subunit p29